MPCDYKKYPANWKQIRAEMMARSAGQCECTGECGLHRTNPGPRRCTELHGANAQWAKGKIVLTIAHLNYPGGPCDHVNPCDDPSHLKAMCQRCHLRMDRELHIANGKATRERKKLESLTRNGHVELL